MSNTIEIDLSKISINFSNITSVISLIDKQSLQETDVLVKRFNLMIKAALVAVKEIGNRHNYYDHLAQLDKQIDVSKLNSLIEDFYDLSDIMELGLNVDRFIPGSTLEDLHNSFQAAFSLLHNDIEYLNSLKPATPSKAA